MTVPENSSESQESRNDQDDEPAEFYLHYEAKEIIGKGLTSTVRKCVEKRSGQEFAVKIIDLSDEKLGENQTEETRLSALRELQLLRQLIDQPYIIQIHDFYETPTFIFIIFELCRNGELFDYLTHVVTLSEKKTRNIMRQLLEAIKAMHDRKIVHRDVKPENILMVDQNQIKLTDFGFAYQLSGDELLHDLCGTPGYLAPEMLRRSMYEGAPGYGLEVDLWSAGVVMYTLLVGYAPFFHRRQIYMLRLIMDGKYEFRSPDWDEISQSAKDLIVGLLTVDTRKRFTVADALNHPFFQGQIQKPVEIKTFAAKKRFRLAGRQVALLIRLLNIRKYPIPLTAERLRNNPYGYRKLHKCMDACAFQIYGHWIKKGRADQDRHVLFATIIRNTYSTDNDDDEKES